MYGYQCAYCDGIVRERIIEQEAFKHPKGFVVLEDVPIGICDECGYRYYHSTVLQRVEEVATGKQPPEHTEQISVARFARQLLEPPDVE